MMILELVTVVHGGGRWWNWFVRVEREKRERKLLEGE
jgi:hypothetical protein